MLHGVQLRCVQEKNERSHDIAARGLVFCVAAASNIEQGAAMRKIIYRFNYNFNNLRFKQTQDINDCSAAHVVIYVVSSEILKFRLLN